MKELLTKTWSTSSFVNWRAGTLSNVKACHVCESGCCLLQGKANVCYVKVQRIVNDNLEKENKYLVAAFRFVINKELLQEKCVLSLIFCQPRSTKFACHC